MSNIVFNHEIEQVNYVWWEIGITELKINLYWFDIQFTELGMNKLFIIMYVYNLCLTMYNESHYTLFT